jgi:hypothetical protein
LVLGHDGIALRDLGTVRQPSTCKADQVPVRGGDNLQALRNGERNRMPIAVIRALDGIIVLALAGSLLD